jgi:hypothetical protein
MLNDANLPNSFWEDAVEYAGHSETLYLLLHFQISHLMNPSLGINPMPVTSELLAAKCIYTYPMKEGASSIQKLSHAPSLDMQRINRPITVLTIE